MSNPEQLNVEHAFNPELRQAQAELDEYLGSRPYEDVKGNIHDPITDKFVNPDSYFNGARSDHEEESQTPYEEMGALELARELAEAEILGDKTTSGNVYDVLLNKMIDKSIAMSREDRKEPLSEEDALDIVSKRVLGYKDKYKSSILGGESSLTTEEEAEETRAKIDYEKVQNYVQEFDKLGAPTSDLMNDIPAQAFYNGNTPKETKDAMPQSYWDWYASRPDVTRNRIDSEDAAEHMIQLSEAGVPHDVLQDFPAEFFYKEGDPGQLSEYPESYKEYLKDKPELAKELHAKGLYDDYETSEGSGEPVAPKGDESSSSKKRFWSGKRGVVFDKLGNAQVVQPGEEFKDSNERLKKASKNVAVLALSGVGYKGAINAQKQSFAEEGKIATPPVKPEVPDPVPSPEKAIEDRDPADTYSAVKKDLENVTPDLRSTVLAIVHGLKGFEGLSAEQQAKFVQGGLINGLLKHEHITVEEVEDSETGEIGHRINLDDEFKDYVRQFIESEKLSS